MQEFEKYPELAEQLQEYAAHGRFVDWQKFTDVLNKTLKQVTSDGWISVKDQLPEYESAVLVCEEGDENTIEICRLESKTERKEKISHEWIIGRNGYDSWYHDVTHWQRLPACGQHTLSTK